jgi:hypothetical protein
VVYRSSGLDRLCYTNLVFNGWVGFTGSELYRYDRDFTDATKVKLADASAFQNLFIGAPDTPLLRLDNTVRVYHGATGVLDAPLFTAPTGTQISDVLIDAQATYVRVNNPTSVWKIPAGGSAVKLADIANAGYLFDQTTNSLILISGTSILAVSKTTGAQTILANDFGALGSPLIKGDRLFYTTTGGASEKLINDAGTLAIAQSGNRFFNVSLPTQFGIDAGAGIDKVILVSKQPPFAITALDPLTALTTSLGSVSSATAQSFVTNSNDYVDYGSQGLGFVADAGGLSDLYFGDANVANSLKRLTNNLP